MGRVSQILGTCVAAAARSLRLGVAPALDLPVGLNQTANHLVFDGRFRGTLRTSGSGAPGYLTFSWDFPEPVTAFGADFFSIGGSRQVSVAGRGTMALVLVVLGTAAHRSRLRYAK